MPEAGWARSGQSSAAVPSTAINAAAPGRVARVWQVRRSRAVDILFLRIDIGLIVGMIFRNEIP